jgi:hypothetical protein
VEKPARDLLARADLGERAVFGRIEIDLQRLLSRVRFVSVHDGENFPLCRISKNCLLFNNGCFAGAFRLSAK